MMVKHNIYKKYILVMEKSLAFMLFSVIDQQFIITIKNFI